MKLDFKSIESLEPALNRLKEKLADIQQPVFINADILQVNSLNFGNLRGMSVIQLVIKLLLFFCRYKLKIYSTSKMGRHHCTNFINIKMIYCFSQIIFLSQSLKVSRCEGHLNILDKRTLFLKYGS